MLDGAKLQAESARPAFQSLAISGSMLRSQRRLKAWPHASHFVAALRSTWDC